MKTRLFWKTWGSLWVALMLTFALSSAISKELESLDQARSLKDRPWKVAESLAIEAERLADRGGDLRAWSASEQTNRLGTVLLLAPDGRELNGRALPEAFSGAALRPFARDRGAGQQHADDEPAPLRGFARTVFTTSADEPYTLIFLPDAPLAWAESISSFTVLAAVGLLLSCTAAWLFSRHLVRPLAALFVASEKAALGDFSERPGQSFGTRRDELAELARRFDDMNSALGRAAEFQRSLLRDVSHELRSPLARLQVAADLATTSGAELAKPRIDKEVAELESLIGEILALSRLDHAPDVVQRERVDLITLLREVAEDARFIGEAQGKTVLLDLASRAAIVHGDERLLRRAVGNVAVNAVAYTRHDEPVSITLADTPGGWEISVCDGGPGVPPAELNAIFQPFYRSACSRSGHDGHGIGLAMTARIIAQHGGHVTASNREARGLCVKINLNGALDVAA